MTTKFTPSMDLFSELYQDCLKACANQLNVHSKLSLKRIAITGGTGFLGTWIAEMISALNDEYELKITLDLYARNTAEWEMKYPHLSSRKDIRLYSQDVRSPFQFQSDTNFVIHAAGVPNNRVHASDPLRVFHTTVDGIKNALEAASQLDNLYRFLNVSSGLVGGKAVRLGGLSEMDYFPIPSGQLHLVYVDAKRSAESIAAIYRSQFRMPISTIRPFTFAGPYQSLDRPWAINSFLGDALMGRDIRIHGDGSARRSYLYGSDAAWWALVALVNGADGAVYNVGSPAVISHAELAQLISKKMTLNFGIATNTIPNRQGQRDELYPNVEHIQSDLGVIQTCSLEHAIDKTWRWFSSGAHLGVGGI
jgi:nucleoside-diphosphate-sugar epimerase